MSRTLDIGIHVEPSGSGLGGGEYAACVLAEALAADGHEVEILHHRPAGWSREELTRLFTARLTGIRQRYVERTPLPADETLPLWRRYREARRWQAAMSHGRDVFVSITHALPPFNHARRGILWVLFPAQTLAHPTEAPRSNSSLRQWLATRYPSWEHRRRMASYDHHTAISAFSGRWCDSRWGIETETIHPPIDPPPPPGRKINGILSVGRFVGSGRSKKQLEMVEVFRRLSVRLGRDRGPCWRYHTVGVAGPTASERAYVDAVDAAAVGHDAIDVGVNIDRSELHRLYRRSRIFWHAAGFGHSPTEQPERLEHFGISTVEAMSAGCVPVVLDGGGQREIVEHGVSGFLWRTLDELEERTAELVANRRLWRRMSAAARERAAQYSRARFVGALRGLIDSRP